MFRVMTGLARQQAGGGQAGACGGVDAAAAAADARANLNAELEKKLGRPELIRKNFQERQPDLLQWAGEVKRFKAGSMQELQGFVNDTEAKLKTLVDEQAVLKLMGEDWPEDRYDNFLLACKEYE